jgi:hypothetical protein
MKTIFKTIFALVAVTLSACTSDSATTTPPTAAGSTGFSWRENDPASTTIQTAASASFSTQYKTLIAKNAAGNTIFEINLTGATVATYNFGAGTGNALAFITPVPFFDATSGNFKITAIANGKMSGTFEAFTTGTGITRLYGTVTDIMVNP